MEGGTGASCCAFIGVATSRATPPTILANHSRHVGAEGLASRPAPSDHAGARPGVGHSRGAMETTRCGRAQEFRRWLHQRHNHHCTPERPRAHPTCCASIQKSNYALCVGTSASIRACACPFQNLSFSGSGRPLHGTLLQIFPPNLSFTVNERRYPHVVHNFQKAVNNS